jgi:CRP-like cAMP-binding protein
MVSPELLRRYPYFAKLTDTQLRAIAMIAEETSCDTGSALLQEREPADWFFILIEGGIDLTYKSEETYHPKTSKVFQVGEVNPGEVFGISSLVEPFLYNATATASLRCRVIKFDAKALRALADLDCSLGYNLMQQVAKAVMERLTYTRIQLAAARA